MKAYENESPREIHWRRSLRFRLMGILVLVPFVLGNIMLLSMMYVYQMDQVVNEKALVFSVLGVLVLLAIAVSVIANLYVIQRLVISPVEMLVSFISLYRPDLMMPGNLQDKKADNEPRTYDEFALLENAILEMMRSIDKTMKELMGAEHKISKLLIESEKAFYDPLTNLYNRRYFDEAISRILKSLSRNAGTLSVMMIDVDFFKKYNDYYGHCEGDYCLKKVAEIIANSAYRPDDFAVRFGGEEFVVVMPNTDEAGARRVAERLLENIHWGGIPHEKSEIADYVTVSVGLTTGSVRHEHDAKDYLKKADEMLYRSKHEGRNRYTFESLESELCYYVDAEATIPIDQSHQ